MSPEGLLPVHSWPSFPGQALCLVPPACEEWTLRFQGNGPSSGDYVVQPGDILAPNLDGLIEAYARNFGLALEVRVAARLRKTLGPAMM